jgi:polysaccharide biosynthesis protein PslJ
VTDTALEVPAGGERRPSKFSRTILWLAAGFGLLLSAAAATHSPKAAMLVVSLFGLLAITAGAIRSLTRWHTLVSLLVATIFLIPIKRYTVPGNAFNLEPYRILVALLAGVWIASLLIDRRVRLRRSGLEAPILVFVVAVIASIAFNDGRIRALGVDREVIKTLTFFASFFILFYLVVSVVRTYAQIDQVVRVLVGCGGIVAAAAVVESVAHFNVFNHLHLPGLQYNDPALTAGLTSEYLGRSGVLRVYASSAHPIELSAVMVMVVPLAAYLLKTTGQRRWLVTALLCIVACFSTLSRTGIVMLLVVGLVFLWLRPAETRRLWPWLVVGVVVLAVALPHALGGVYSSFFPKGGIIAEQSQQGTGPGQDAGHGRLTTIGPSLREWSATPVLGQGFGSRISQRLGVENRVKTTARILDDQWLGSLLETGIVGVAGLLWLFTRTIRRLIRKAKVDDGPPGWLAVALAASIYGFCVSMLTFDAFGFIQVTILMFLLLGLSASLLRADADSPNG